MPERANKERNAPADSSLPYSAIRSGNDSGVPLTPNTMLYDILHCDTFEEYLQEIIARCPGYIAARVAQNHLNTDDPLGSLQYVTEYGCINGTVPSMIYYTDTYAFFNWFIPEIDDIRLSYEESTGCKVGLGSDTRNTLAWFAYEQVAFEILNHWENICP